jgi:hypothetical protein
MAIRVETIFPGYLGKAYTSLPSRLARELSALGLDAGYRDWAAEAAHYLKRAIAGLRTSWN